MMKGHMPTRLPSPLGRGLCRGTLPCSDRDMAATATGNRFTMVPPPPPAPHPMSSAPPMPRQSDLQFRRLDAEDAVAFAALRREVAAYDPVPMGITLEEELTRPLQGFREQLSFPQPNAAFGVFGGDQLLGSAAIAWANRFPSWHHKATLWGVFVAPAHRGGGVGRAIVMQALDHAFAHGVQRVNLQMFLPNPTALSLYHSLGFVSYGCEPQAVCLAGEYHDSLYMSLHRPTTIAADTRPVEPR